ncbi:MULTISPECIES: NADPH:quinone oxidoreductase family protein [unclassified Bradyrhizobium]|uniref:NADPH:quinone oxidoreductase family protein n=1 Tax=unclassified Bradyrhizobium TaxID=2631580 RepID=UPI002FF0902A
MKAVVVENYNSIDGISIKEIDTPGLAAGEVRVRIGAAAVGFVDGLKVQGLYQTKDPLPFVPGTEFAGTVDAVADNIGAFKPGMPVIGMARSGALAEYISVPSAALQHLPPQVPFEAGASFQANYLTGLYALDARASLREGEILLVLGAAGGVGIAAVQIGRLMGARVIAAASTPEKRDFAVRHGADHTIDYTLADWREALKELTGGHGPDVIFDPVGGEVSLQAFRSIAWRGRHLVVGFASGTIPALAFNLPLLKGGALLGVDLAQIQKREPETHARLMAQLFDWLASGKLWPVVGKIVPFENFREAFKTMQSRSALGKMIVKFG